MDQIKKSMDNRIVNNEKYPNPHDVTLSKQFWSARQYFPCFLEGDSGICEAYE